MADEKQYGLILPGSTKQKKVIAIRKLNPLQDSDDDLEKDDEEPLNWVEASLKNSVGNAGQRSIQKRLLKEALEEDSSVFQYDEVYDNIQEKRTTAEAIKKKTAKKSKYIENLLQAADKRKLENERRTERNVQKEREAEGEKFADKESFVTESYKKKLLELKMAEEEEKLELYKEGKLDAMKHKNFYSHIFKQRMGEIEVKKEIPDDSEKEDDSTNTTFKIRDTTQNKKQYRRQRDSSESPERSVKRIEKIKSEPPDSDENERIQRHHSNDGEQYRRRKDRHISDNKYRNARSRSRDKRQRYRSKRNDERSRSRSKGKYNKSHKIRDHNNDHSHSEEENAVVVKNEKDNSEHANSHSHKTKNVNDSKRSAKEIEMQEKANKLELITKLFSKRTVGEKFDLAVQQYFERKANRESRG